ncbi:hypothetical protein PR202_ga22560 [Eleusine coracana subsp. coracana]|uniref:Uncharacterized protein n=1 Tax=Eleusine coracana subsp. coracana TaxID=191504 RepID=A0AAV5D2Y2_ELECO|nr:hypothetical protein PR202_ga22560 [Eleusine coracana subsp. coracana]
MDTHRRAFIWSREEKANGAVCMVAWDKVATPQHCDGLGIQNLRAQNQFLLLKLVHRLHSSTDSAWASWAHEHADIPTMNGDTSGVHWDVL